MRIICVNCPMGCPMEVQVKDGEVSVTGNACPRGAAYAKTECVNPVRMVATTVRLHGAAMAALPVKTAKPVPKGKIFDCVRALKGVEAWAPVSIGDVLASNCAGTGVDIVATKGAARIAD
jgi:CxxC motif-containing protein